MLSVCEGGTCTYLQQIHAPRALIASATLSNLLFVGLPMLAGPSLKSRGCAKRLLLARVIRYD